MVATGLVDPGGQWTTFADSKRPPSRARNARDEMKERERDGNDGGEKKAKRYTSSCTYPQQPQSPQQSQQQQPSNRSLLDSCWNGIDFGVLSLRTETSCCEFHRRDVSNEMRVDWKSPLSVRCGTHVHQTHRVCFV